jgi:hypothetical protein
MIGLYLLAKRDDWFISPANIRILTLSVVTYESFEHFNTVTVRFSRTMETLLMRIRTTEILFRRIRTMKTLFRRIRTMETLFRRIRTEPRLSRLSSNAYLVLAGCVPCFGE